MKAWLCRPGEPGELTDLMSPNDGGINELLGGPSEDFWPFEQPICMAVLADREDLPPNRIVAGLLFRGPVLFLGCHDDLDDLTDDEIDYLERILEYAPEEYDEEYGYDEDNYDPYGGEYYDDVQEDDDYYGYHIDCEEGAHEQDE